MHTCAKSFHQINARATDTKIVYKTSERDAKIATFLLLSATILTFTAGLNCIICMWAAPSSSYYCCNKVIEFNRIINHQNCLRVIEFLSWLTTCMD